MIMLVIAHRLRMYFTAGLLSIKTVACVVVFVSLTASLLLTGTVSAISFSFDYSGDGVARALTTRCWGPPVELRSSMRAVFGAA